MNSRKTNLVIIILILTIVILLIILAYFLVLQPKVQEYIIQKQIEAKDVTLMAIVSQIQQNGYAQINFGNQTLMLVPYVPPPVKQGEQP